MKAQNGFLLIAGQKVPRLGKKSGGSRPVAGSCSPQWSPAGSDVEACNWLLRHSSGDACADNRSEHGGVELDLSVASTNFSTEGVGRSQHEGVTSGCPAK